jgi:hypothetical protein
LPAEIDNFSIFETWALFNLFHQLAKRSALALPTNLKQIPFHELKYNEQFLVLFDNFFKFYDVHVLQLSECVDFPKLNAFIRIIEFLLHLLNRNLYKYV